MASEDVTKSRCADCKKNKPGRITRRDKGLPRWHCWTCLPAGTGSDETKDTKPTSALSVSLTPASAVEAKKEGLEVVTSLTPEVAELTVSNDEEYEQADHFLGRIRGARKKWEERMEKIIRPIRTGLDELYALNREVDKPLGVLESQVKAKMGDYKLIEARRIAEEEEERAAKTAKIVAEAEALARAAEAAATPQMTAKLSAKSEHLMTKARAVITTEVSAPVQGANSSSRPQKKWRIKDAKQFFAAVADGTLELECALVNMPVMNRYFKDTPAEEFAAWPGIEVYDDIQIVGR